MSEQEKLPQDKLHDQDEGPTTVAFGIMKDKVVMSFEKPIHWVGFYPNEARIMGQKLLDLADQLEKLKD